MIYRSSIDVEDVEISPDVSMIIVMMIIIMMIIITMIIVAALAAH